MDEKSGYIIIRYYFLGLWEIGGPVVLRQGSIEPLVIAAYAKHQLPWILRGLFMANTTTSDDLPAEIVRLVPGRAKGSRRRS